MERLYRQVYRQIIGLRHGAVRGAEMCQFRRHAAH